MTLSVNNVCNFSDKMFLQYTHKNIEQYVFIDSDYMYMYYNHNTNNRDIHNSTSAL